MQEKIVLIDGHSLLNRAFYGIPDLTNAEGVHTNAVYGFLNILFKILEEEQPQYFAVAFDLPAPTFRHKMYEDYKGTRQTPPQEFREQVPLTKEVLAAMQVPVLTLEGYEADDILGTAARLSEERGLEVRIISGDRDLLQLATEKTQIRIPKTKGGSTTVENYFAADVLDAWGVRADQIVDLKALMGDSSDNIPGIPGVGVKTATKIIAAFGSIENARAHIDEVAPAKAQAALRDHFDLAELSKKLARIDTAAPIDFVPEQARLGELYTAEAYEVFRRLGFKNFLDRFGEKKKEMPEIRVQIVSNREETEALLRRAASADAVGLHALTWQEGMAPTPQICGLALSFAFDENYYFPRGEALTQEDLCAGVQEILQGAGAPALYALKEHVKAAQIPEREGIFDLTLAAYLLDPLTNDYSCDRLARAYAGVELPSAEEIFGGKKIPAPADMPADEAARYAASCAAAALLLREPVMAALEETGMRRVYTEIELPLAFVLADMELAGIAARAEELAAFGKTLEGRIGEIEAQIYAEAGEIFNIHSPKQLGEILFEKMGLPGGKKTKTGYSTAADVLEKMAPDVPLVADVLEYRQLTKLKSTYADALGTYIAEDGRIHTTFQQTVTATGRLSSADPNLQNIPVRMELGRQIRKVFVPAEGCVFLDADYSQIELRVLAHCSGDEKLIEAYREEKDIHAITASQVFHVPFEEVTPQLRRNAKAVNFGIVYGISSFGLAQDLSISRKEAEEYIQKYFETYPGIKRFLDGAVADAKKNGYSVTLYGRRRPIPELGSSNFMQRSFGERVAMNAPIQGTAADIIKIAMIRVWRRLQGEGLQSRLIMQVHDELLIEAPREEIDAAKAILSEEMTGAADLAVALEIDMHQGENWYEAK